MHTYYNPFLLKFSTWCGQKVELDLERYETCTLLLSDGSEIRVNVRSMWAQAVLVRRHGLPMAMSKHDVMDKWHTAHEIKNYIDEKKLRITGRADIPRQKPPAGQSENAAP